MLGLFARRGVFMVFSLIAVTVAGFLIIQLPPGDFLTLYILELEASGEVVDTVPSKIYAAATAWISPHTPSICAGWAT